MHIVVKTKDNKKSGGKSGTMDEEYRVDLFTLIYSAIPEWHVCGVLFITLVQITNISGF